MKGRERLVILKGKFDDSLFKDFDREQVEKKYGGDVPDVTQFWPPVAFQHHLMKKGVKQIRGIKKLKFFKMTETEIFKSILPNKSKNMNFNYSTIPTLNVSDPQGNTKNIVKSDLNIRKSNIGNRPNYKGKK